MPFPLAFEQFAIQYFACRAEEAVPKLRALLLADARGNDFDGWAVFAAPFHPYHVTRLIAFWGDPQDTVRWGALGVIPDRAHMLAIVRAADLR